MLALLSPSKTQDYSNDICWQQTSTPKFQKDVLELVAVLKSYSPLKLAKLMALSPKLAELNHKRYQNFASSFTQNNSRQALLAFRGDVYSAFDLESYSKGDIKFAQDHIRILSGLYGILRPLDLMQPYRLEMKTKLSTPRGKNLYDFWAHKISESIEQEKPKVIVNLASGEYFKAVESGLSAQKVVTAVFKQKKGKDLKVVALFAKQARGAMANFIVKQRISKPDQLKDFGLNGYRFQSGMSDDTTFTFVRSTTS